MLFLALQVIIVMQVILVLAMIRVTILPVTPVQALPFLPTMRLVLVLLPWPDCVNVTATLLGMRPRAKGFGTPSPGHKGYVITDTIIKRVASTRWDARP